MRSGRALTHRKCGCMQDGKQQLGLFFFKQEDAQALIDQVELEGVAHFTFALLLFLPALLYYFSY